ncbi:D-glyceryl-ACP synthase [Actinomadura pelletieri DSM 43383]|uniref:D-glyceryl-ACP synthase n=1 Tax=Actinomadura pelletieri DSM 43383 TaxID=1120940 RepID=A0A495QA24_9ACTN|nr:HAD-IIIC family phosphatase [Actinomadura pelletieri]RKS68191.1 D-glyceryl-ACP synthase [Actinomadura pelletieri DSM 43383]
MPEASGSEAPGPADTLRELHRTGRLAAEYPRVAGLLAGLSDTELLQAGHLLARLDPADVTAEHPDTPSLTVAVTGHGTLPALVPALTAQLARHGLLLRPHVGDFDGYVFDLGDPDSGLYAARPDLVTCVLDPAVIFDDVPVPWRPDDVERAWERKLKLIDGLAERFEAAGRGVLVLNTVPLPRRFPAQLVDHLARARLGAVWREANARLLRMAERRPSVYVLDLDPLVADGVPADDLRQSVYAKAHLSAGLLAEYAREVGHIARHLTGRTAKALALDLDGTLWGGVLGEDGPEGIEIGEGMRGEAFGAFQRVVKQIGAQGVLLAAVSKNDLEPVRAVLDSHPGMTLREKDFVRIAASWGPKNESIADLAATLNIGTDAFVFVDDSPYECGLVRHSLPGVTVIRVDGEPALHLDRLLRDGWFTTRELTADDRARVDRYRVEVVRKDFLDGFESIEDYLHELRVEVRLTAADDADTARISQLTQRTNQFNLTGLRLGRTEVRERVADPDALVLAVRTRDRFGDNGLVGAVLTRRVGATVHIENFLLSCRVFSRGIEPTALAAILRYARSTGAEEVLADYRKTAKNHGARDFYPRYGFEQVAEDGPTTTYRHDLADIVDTPDHITLTEELRPADLAGDA